MEQRSKSAQRVGRAHAEIDPRRSIDVKAYLFGSPSVQIMSALLQRAFAAAATLGALIVASMSSAHAQAAPPLGTLPPFAVLGASTVTNTGVTTLTGTAALPGNLGVFPGGSAPGTAACPGADCVIYATGGVEHLGDVTAQQAQADLTTAFDNLAARPAGVNLSGMNLGGLTLVPGVYNFNSSAQLTGNLTLNGLGNSNAVFIFNIGSSLTTASASSITLINGAQGGNVFFQVGSSATLGTATSFAGDILAQTSITLDTSAIITCGAVWARTGAVTLDTNTISLCDLIAAVAGPGVPILGPGGFPLFTSLLPASAPSNDVAVAIGLDNAIGSGVTVPLAFVNLANLSPAALASALSQLSGEAATAVAPAGIQAMNSFLSVLSNPFMDSRGYAPPQPAPPIVSKMLVLKAPGMAEQSRWGIWTAAYGGWGNTNGDPWVGSSDRSASVYGSIVGLDYRVTPYTLLGVALAGGGTHYSLANGLGGGYSNMVQAAIYSFTRINAAYLATTLAYGWQHESTGRFLSVAGSDELTAGFAANNIGGRIEGGYRFAVPVFALPGLGFIPYAAFQMQAFYTPAYNESATSGSPQFALAYDAQTTTATRTELGAWFDDVIALDNGAMLTLRSRAAWAYDDYSSDAMTAAFQQLPGSSFTVIGATPTRDSLLASAGAEMSFRNGVSLAGQFDSQLADASRTYSGFVALRYAF